MATIRFFIRTITKDKNVLVPVYVRLKYGRKIDITAKSDLLTKPDNWSNETQQARQRADTFNHKAGNNEDSGRKAFNEKVKELRTAIEDALIQVHKEDITPGWFKVVIDKHWHPEKYQINLFSYIEKFIEDAKTKPNRKTKRPVGYKMQREYQVTFDYLKKYAAQNSVQLDFGSIDMAFYTAFNKFLEDEKLSINTVGKKIQVLKTFLNNAKKAGVNKFNAFQGEDFVKPSEEADTIYLNESELTRLYDLDLSNRPGYEKTRDLFLVACWTGVRFSDLNQITPENISNGMITLKQRKTGNRVTIPLHPVVTAILNKHSNQLPAPISNQKFNVELKKIAELAKINDVIHKEITKGGVKRSTAYKKYELVTSHAARRSFCTNLYKSGFPALSIMQISGHRSEEIFLRYIRVTPDEHAKKLQEHWGTHLKVV